MWPGVAIALAVLGLNLLGDGLRDLDPAWREKDDSPSRFAPSPLYARCALWGDAASARSRRRLRGLAALRGRRNTPSFMHSRHTHEVPQPMKTCSHAFA